MSDSSSSEDEESRFKEICDPTLWRTAAEGGVEDSKSQVQPPVPQQHHHNHSSDRQSFLLLEKVKASLAASQTKTARPRISCDGSGSYKRGSRIVDASLGNIPAPSTLSPYLAKQLSTRLDGSVGFCSNHKDPAPVSQECDGTNQPSFHLLRNVSLLPQDSEAQGRTQQRRPKVPKRLCYYASSDEEDLKSKCSSVAVSPEWILGGGESCPRPHPKNVRYLDEYRVKEHRPDGSIIAVPCSALDSTDTAPGLGKRKKKKAKECVSKNEKDDSSCKKEKVQGNFQNGVDNISEDLHSPVKIQRKQTRKRGKKKKNTENSEGSTL